MRANFQRLIATYWWATLDRVGFGKERWLALDRVFRPEGLLGERTPEGA